MNQLSSCNATLTRSAAGTTTTTERAQAACQRDGELLRELGLGGSARLSCAQAAELFERLEKKVALKAATHQQARA